MTLKSAAGWVISRSLYILILAFFALLPVFITDAYYLRIFIFIGIYVVLALSLNLINGYTGLLSIGHAAFYGIGAYSSALLTLKLGVPFLLALPLSGVIAGAFGFLIGKPTLRLTGIFLTLSTLGFNIIFVLLSINWEGLTRGPLGIAGIPVPAMFGYTFGSQQDYYYLVFFLVLFTLGSMYRLIHSRFGMALLAIREEDTAAEAVGVHTVHYKMSAFVISTFYAGLAGSFFAHYIRFIAPDNFTFWESFTLLAMLALGGQGNLVGPIAGASALIALPEVFRFLTDHRMIFYGIILIVMMLFRREGIFSRRTYNLRITPPWEKRESGPRYLVGDKFLTDDAGQEKKEDGAA
ncbi:MAG TPA: branched-chain amino acid ABC transporter permease [Thermodesulfobacteriota bacterium]|nr:branched-chain amino acid ABC transporter permease [Thermodesulfobacteriota bacterium]